MFKHLAHEVLTRAHRRSLSARAAQPCSSFSIPRAARFWFRSLKHPGTQVNTAAKQLRITRIIIAHRPDTIGMADRVIRIDAGRVAQELRRVPAPVHAGGEASFVPLEPALA